MSWERLVQSGKMAVGSKQTLRAIESGLAKMVFLAEDADQRLKHQVTVACQARGLEPVLVPTMIALGRACGIQVGSASAAIIEK
ncbi:MAG: ribosomal L7Ae/L30e/S12e/Gadd45 family protein [Bacillota bacterium]